MRTAVYPAIGITMTGEKEVLGPWLAQESRVLPRCRW